MNTILCVDNSVSTSGCTKYWEKCRDIYDKSKPYRTIYWGSEAKYMHRFKVRIGGATMPETFIRLLQKEEVPFQLIITTDGEIANCSIEECDRLLKTSSCMSLIDSVTIYYIGNKDCMNLGLNIIFNYTKITYYVNEDGGNDSITDFSTISVADLISPNLIFSLSAHIQHIKRRKHSQEQLAQLKQIVTKRFAELEGNTIDAYIDGKLKKYYENNQPEKFIKLLKEDREKIAEVASCKARALNLFNTHNSSTNISHLLGRPSIPEQDVPVPEAKDVNAAWVDFEDNITMEPFTFPGVLIQRTPEPIITDQTILKHPFLLLSKPDLIKKILDLVEPNPVDYTTYQKLREAGGGGYIVSPFTRAPCHGVFLFDAADFKCIKNNARCISVMFGKKNKVPGNLVLWNLIFMYIIYKQNRLGDEFSAALLSQLKEFCDRFQSRLSFTHQCQVIRSAPLPMCFWFCVHAVTKVTPNSSFNVMRSVFGKQLFDVYTDILGPADRTSIAEVTEKVNKWTAWNYLIANRDRPELKLEVKAQYQDYLIHNESIILKAGACKATNGPFKCELNLVNGDTANTLFKSLKNSSSKLDDIDYFKKAPVKVYESDETGLGEYDTHVKINIYTCWPYVKCPVTGLHWRACLKKNFNIKKFDKQKGSHVKFFDTYCYKHKKYPESYMDLVLFYSKKFYPYITTDRHLTTMEHVFDLFKEVMKLYTCKEYLRIYCLYYKEEARLALEES